MKMLTSQRNFIANSMEKRDALYASTNVNYSQPLMITIGVQVLKDYK